MVFCASRIQDLTQYLGNSDQGNCAERSGVPVAQPPSAPEFISTSITRPRTAPAGYRSVPHSDMTSSFLLSSLSSCQRRFYHFADRLFVSRSPEPVWFSVFGCCAVPCVSLGLGSAPSLLRPALCTGPSNPGSAGLALHALIGQSGHPPAPSLPARSHSGPSIHTKFGSGAAEGGGGPARPSSAHSRPDPGPGSRTSPYLIPAPV